MRQKGGGRALAVPAGRGGGRGGPAPAAGSGRGAASAAPSISQPLVLGEPITGTPVGRETLMRLLEREMIVYTPEQLIEIGNREYAWTENEMKKASREMGFGDDSIEALEKVKNAYVPPGQQPALVRNLELQAEKFVREKGPHHDSDHRQRHLAHEHDVAADDAQRAVLSGRREHPGVVPDRRHGGRSRDDDHEGQRAASLARHRLPRS